MVRIPRTHDTLGGFVETRTKFNGTVNRLLLPFKTIGAMLMGFKTGGRDVRVVPPKRARISALLLAVMFAVLASVMSSCAPDIYSGGDQYICVLNTLTGKITKQIPPGQEDSYTLGDNEVSYAVPTSQRFYNVDTKRDIADDGAPGWLSGYSADYGNMKAIVHLEFFIRQTHACDFVLRHGKRNDPDETGDLEFGARLPKGDKNAIKKDGSAARKAKTIWAVWLNENFAPNMQDVMEPMLLSYDTAHLVFNYPVNANSYGELPVDAAKGELTQSVLEEEFGEMFSDQLKSKVGDFFCGVGYDPETDECPPVTATIVRISTDGSFIKNRKAVTDAREERDNAAQLALIQKDTLANRKANAEDAAALREIEKQEALDAALVEEAKGKVELQKKINEASTDPTIIRCIILAQQAGGCPEVEQAKQNNGSTTVNVAPQPGG